MPLRSRSTRVGNLPQNLTFEHYRGCRIADGVCNERQGLLAFDLSLFWHIRLVFASARRNGARRQN